MRPPAAPRAAAALFTLFALFTLTTLTPAHADLTPDERRQSARYAEILQSDPAHVVARQRLWALHATAGDTATLLDDYATRSAESLPAALTHAYLLLESGDPTSALTALDATATTFPEDPTPLLAKAEILAAQSEDPIPTLVAALALAPENPDIADRLTRARLAAGDPTSLLADAPNDPALRRELADQLLAANRPDEARPHLEWLAAKGNPTQRVDALRTLSDVAEQKGDLPAAIEFADQAANRLGPTHWLRPDLETRVTNLRARSGTLEARRDRLWDTTLKSPGDWRAWREIARIESVLGNPAAQVAALESAVAAAPSDDSLRYELIRAEADFGDLDLAYTLVGKLIAQRPNDPEPIFLRADLDVRAGRLAAARSSVDALVAANPSLRPRAIAFFESTRLDEAATALRAQAAADGDPEASLALANSHLESSDLPAAIAALTAAKLDADTNLRAAALLRSHDHVAATIPFLEAARLQAPDHLEPVQQLAAALVATDQTESAVAVLEAALATQPDKAATLDRQIYDSLAATPDQLTAHLETIQSDPERFARWQLWSGDAEPPDPNESRPIVPDAETLDELATAAREAPASVEALTNLAAARQSASDYYGALEPWTEAFARAPANDRTDLLPPILAATARLQLPDRGLGFLVDYARSRPGEADRITAWADAVTFAEKNANLDLLESELATSPDEYPTAVARAAIQSARGDDPAAFRTLESSARLAADPAAARDRTLAAAARTGEDAAVIRSAARVTAESNAFSDWRAAATALEAVGAADTAGATWRAIHRKFNRDPDALTAVAAYADRTGEAETRATALYAAAELDPRDPVRLAEAAALAETRGDRDRAIDFYYQILAATHPLEPDPARFPGFDEVSAEVTNAAHSLAMRAIGGLADVASVATVRSTADRSTAVATAAARLAAIRALAHLSTGGSTREEWLAWCAQATPFEAAWGFYSADEFAPAHAALLTLLATTPDPAPVERALIWNALRRSSFETLRAWINSDPTVRRRRTELLFLGLSRLLGAHAADPTPAQIETLFPKNTSSASTRSPKNPQRPPSPKSPNSDAAAPKFGDGSDSSLPSCAVTNVERWRAAWLFASHAKLTTALQLGENSGDFPNDQQLAETQLASWHLLLGDRDAALADLALTADLPADRLDAPAITALRMRWLLMTPPERAALAKSISPDAFASQALIAALSNDTEGISKAAIRLVDSWKQKSGGSQGSTPISSFVRSGVSQLHPWNLPALALAICEAAADSEALVASQSNDGRAWRTELAALTAASRLMLAAPRETAFVVDDLDTRNFDFQTWATLARTLDTNGYTAAAIAVRDELLSRFPNEPATLNERATSAAAADDLPLQADLLERNLASGRLGSNFPAIVDQTEQLATLRFKLHDPAAALPFIDRVLALAPADPRLVDLKDRALANLGRTDERREFWNRQIEFDPATGGLGRARFLVEIGEAAPAITSLRRLLATRPPNTAEVRTLLFQTEARHGDRAAAIAELERLAATDQWEAVGQLAPAIAESGDPAPVAKILRQGLRAASNPRVRFACGRILFHLPGPPPSIAEAQHDLDQMRHAAEADLELIPKLYETGSEFAARSPANTEWFLDQMRAEWQDGDGSRLAAEQLIVRNPPSLDVLLDQYLVPRHYDAVAWATIADQLATSAHPAAAARVFHELANRAPDQPGFIFREATQLWLAGERSAAIARVEPWLAIREFDPSLQRQAADFFRDIGRPTRAIELYAEIVAEDVAVRHSDAWIELAKLQQNSGRLDAAKLFLLTAFQNPNNRDWPAAEAFLAARGDLTSLDPEVNEFHLRADDWRQVRLAIAQRLVDQGSYQRALTWISPAILPNESAATLLMRIAKRGDLRDEVTTFWQTAIAQLPESADLKTQHATYEASAAKPR